MLCAFAAATVESTAPQAARLRNVAIMTVLRGWARLPGCLTSLLKPLPTVPAGWNGRALTNVQLVLGEVRPTPPVGFHAEEGGRERKTPRALMGMPIQRRNRVCAIFTGNEFDWRRFDWQHRGSLHIFTCRPFGLECRLFGRDASAVASWGD